MTLDREKFVRKAQKALNASGQISEYDAKAFALCIGPSAVAFLENIDEEYRAANFLERRRIKRDFVAGIPHSSGNIPTVYHAAPHLPPPVRALEHYRTTERPLSYSARANMTTKSADWPRRVALTAGLDVMVSVEGNS